MSDATVPAGEGFSCCGYWRQAPAERLCGMANIQPPRRWRLAGQTLSQYLLVASRHTLDGPVADKMANLYIGILSHRLTLATAPRTTFDTDRDVSI